MSIRRFVPVPYDALDHAPNAGGEAFILMLFRKGHSRRWQPFHLEGQRKLQDRYDMTRGELARLLEALEFDGLVSLEVRRQGGRRSAGPGLALRRRPCPRPRRGL